MFLTGNELNILKSKKLLHLSHLLLIINITWLYPFFTDIDPIHTHSPSAFLLLFIISYMEVRIVEAENEVYQKDKLLGEGAFGKAYLVRKKDTGELLVIKEVNIDHMSQKQQEETIKEAQILRNFKHPLIVRFVEVYATKQNKLKIVMEYAECGDLSKAIAARRTAKRPFEETQILDWFTQICLAMKHVHDRKILHRDIKGQNIFITKANTLKLGDFGIARVLNKTQDKARTVVGTPYYLSPQIIENKPYSFKSDIWSMGVLLYEMCALAPPFNANSLQMLALKIVKGSYQPITGNYSKELKGLISEILHIDPNKRPFVGEILERPFIKQRIQKFLSETNHKIEFSHTILHNHKVQISNKLVKVQDEKKLESERNRLKEEAALLKEKMDKRKEEDRAKEEERFRRKRQEELRKQEDNLKRKQQQVKMRQLQQKRAIQERKQWVEREKRKQSQEQQRKRVSEIAEYAKQREKEERERDFRQRKEKLQRQKYQLQKNEREMGAQKKKNKEKEQIKKMEDFNEFARKQWFQNQMIRKRAEQRAKQSELDTYQSETHSIQQQPQYQRPQSKNKNSNPRDSRQKKIVSQQPEVKRKSLAYEPSEEQLQNALLNPNYHKKTPQPQVKSKAPQPSKTPIVPKAKEEIKQDKSKKNYDQAREKMKKDREQFLKGKSHKNEETHQEPIETLKPGKWQKRSKSREREENTPSNSRNKVNSPAQAQEDLLQSGDMKLNIKDQEQLKDYLNQLEGLLNNVNKNIEKLQQFPEIPVEKEIILREDDNEELDYSMTGSFDIALQPPVQQGNADFNLFSDYSKLEELKMSLQEKFGTEQFIKIYRMLQHEMQTKGLENFNILQLEKQMGKQVDKKLILQNLTMLLTLIVMEERMGC